MPWDISDNTLLQSTLNGSEDKYIKSLRDTKIHLFARLYLYTQQATLMCSFFFFKFSFKYVLPYGVGHLEEFTIGHIFYYVNSFTVYVQ